MSVIRAWTAAVCVAWVVAGCASSAKSPPPGDYRAMYESGQFATAYDAAAAKASASRGSVAEEASLYAGLSAYRLGRAGDAHRHLVPLTSSGNAAVAGRACAALGSLAATQGTHASAAEYFTKAGSLLTGDDAARALMYAGDAKVALGKKDEAEALYTKAQGKVQDDGSLRLALGDRLAGRGATPVTSGGGEKSGPPGGGGVFTVQAGAFKAQSTARTTADGLIKRGYEARVVPIRDKAGVTLYAVRVGRYATKAQAEAVRKAVGTSAIITGAE
ncbi:MAG: hypothetical protein HBSAPP03_12110 [Phycisphaerae bacterium]|nr:MAG: hypothetical protein HBSAPP03_12110 [Phycisphaerae bacterium]